MSRSSPEPGLRGTHTVGQILIVTAGCGWTQCWKGPVKIIRPSDVNSCPTGHGHWHRATKDTAMTHIAIVEQLDGKTGDWMEQVSDEAFQAGMNAE